MKARIYKTHRPRNGTTLLHGPRKIYMPNSVTIWLHTKPSSDTWCGHHTLANRRVPASPQSFNSTQACAVGSFPFSGLEPTASFSQTLVQPSPVARL